MVKCFLSMDDGYIHFQIKEDSSSKFDELVSFFRENHITFDKKTRSYISEPDIKCKDVYEELKNYAEIEILEEDIDFIENLELYPPSDELKKIKFSVDKQLLEKHPPLKGRSGYENYQLNAIKDFIMKNRTFLNIPPRFGKTYITVMGIGTLMNLGKLDCVLAIMRTEGLVNYKMEILRFLPFVKEEDIVILDKNSRDIETYFDKKFILMSYSTWRLTNEFYKKQKKINAKKTKKHLIDFDKWYEHRLLLVDECQSICGDSLQSHYTIIHSNMFERRCVMSGSIGYSMEKTYNLAKVLTPNRIPMSKTEWWNYITVQGYSKWKREIIPERLEEFKNKVLNPVMTTVDESALPLTDNYIHNVYVEMNDKMRTNYQNICNEFLLQSFKENNGKVSVRQLNQKFPYLKQSTDDMSLMNVANWNMEKDNPKIEVLSSILEKKIDEEGRKVILWCSSPRTMLQLKNIYSKYNPIYVSGDEKSCGVKRDERADIIEEIKTSKDCKLLICNQVLSTSVSFWQFSVNIYWCIPMDADYYQQSIKRIMGVGQKNKVETIHLIVNKSIDLYLYESLVNKIETKKYFDSEENLSMEKLKLILNPTHKFTINGDVNSY